MLVLPFVGKFGTSGDGWTEGRPWLPRTICEYPAGRLPRGPRNAGSPLSPSPTAGASTFLSLSLLFLTFKPLPLLRYDGEKSFCVLGE